MLYTDRVFLSRRSASPTLDPDYIAGVIAYAAAGAADGLLFAAVRCSGRSVSRVSLWWPCRSAGRFSVVLVHAFYQLLLPR